MTDFQDETPQADAPFFAAADLGDAPLTASASALFQPVATAPAETCDEALERLATELADFAQRGSAAFSQVADLMAIDADHDDIAQEAQAFDDGATGRLTMASLIRADTPIGLAAKGRAVLALRTLIDGCETPEADDMLISMAEDAVRLAGQTPDHLWAAQDAAVIHAANEVRRLSAENELAWRDNPDLDERHQAQVSWNAGASEAKGRFEAAVAHLATLRPLTPAGLAAKAATVPTLVSLHDFIQNWAERDLIEGIAADALRIGAALAPASDPNIAVTGSTERTGGAPLFEPVATAPACKMDRWPNTLDRTSEQRLLDYNREYERVIAFYEAADDANDRARSAAKEATENVLAHAERMLKEVAANAYLVPARNIREVALKARIMSHAKAEFWDPANADEQDADIRFLIEDVLSLGGLDRIKKRDFAFDYLIPGYGGSARAGDGQGMLAQPNQAAA